MRRYIQHFLFLNILALLLGWLVTNDTPERVYVTADAEPGFVIQSDCGRGCRFDTHSTQTKHFWLPTGFFNGDLTLKRQAGASNVKLNAVRVWSRLVLERRWTNPSDLVFSTNGTVTLSAHRSRSGLSRVGWVVLTGGEAFLLFLAALFNLISTSAKSEYQGLKSGRSRLIYSSVIAGAVALFCGLIIPLQTLLANVSELNISITSVLFPLAIRSFFFCCTIIPILCWTTRFAGALYLILFSAFLTYEYLETGILTIGAPSLTGDMKYYKDIFRMIWDTAMFPVIFILILLLYRSFRWTVLLVASDICILGLSSLFDVNTSKSDYQAELAIKFKSKNSVVNECVYSTNKNILVFVLDSATTRFAQRLLDENKVFADALTGFTAYTNNLGMYPATVTAVAGMATGTYYDDTSKSGEFINSIFSHKSFLTAYLNEDTAIFFNPGSSKVGVSRNGIEYHSTHDTSSAAHKDDRDAILKRMSGQQPWNLLEIARFRLSPFAGKYIINVLTAGGWNLTDDAENEACIYPIIAKAPIKGIPLALHWFHTMGMHPPYGISRTGVDDGVVRNGDSAKLDKLYFVLSLLVDHLAKLKERGIYDRSLIIVTADHGVESDSDERHEPSKTHLTGRAFPILFVKPMFASGKLCSSDLPTSHARIHDLLVKSRDRCLTKSEIDAILTANERVYSQPNPNARGFDNITLDAVGKASYCFRPSSGADPLAKPIDLDRVYSLLCSSSDACARMKNIHFFTADGAAMVCNGVDGILQFRLSASKRYRVVFDVCAVKGAHINCELSGSHFEIPKSKDHIRFKCPIDVCTDTNGIASVSFNSIEPLAIFSLTVSKSSK